MVYSSIIITVMKFNSLCVAYDIELEEKLSNLQKVFENLKLSDAFQCIKYHKLHKCQTEYASDPNHNHNKLFLFHNKEIIKINMKYKKYLVHIQIKDKVISVDYRTSNKIDIDIIEISQIIIQELGIKNYKNINIGRYSEIWRFNKTTYSHNLIDTKIKDYQNKNSENVSYKKKLYTETYRYLIKLGSAEVNIWRDTISITIRKKFNTHMKLFKDFVKDVFNLTIKTKYPFPAKLTSTLLPKKDNNAIETDKEENYNIVITI